MTLTLQAKLQDLPASAAPVPGDSEYERQLAWLRNAIEEGWQAAKAGNLTYAEDFEIEFAEFERQWLAEQATAKQDESLPAH